MTALTPPAMESARPEEWGAFAVSISGWPTKYRQPSGQLVDDHGLEWVFSDQSDWDNGGSGNPVPNPDHDGTAGCLLALLGPGWCFQHDEDGWVMWRQFDKQFFYAPTLGRAAIAAAAALGRWPGGNSDWAHEDVAQRAVRLLGTDHPDAGSTMGDLAEALRQLSALRCSLVRPGGSDG